MTENNLVPFPVRGKRTISTGEVQKLVEALQRLSVQIQNRPLEIDFGSALDCLSQACEYMKSHLCAVEDDACRVELQQKFEAVLRSISESKVELTNPIVSLE